MCPEYLKNINRGKYYVANIAIFSENGDLNVVLGVPPLQKSIDYKSDINDLYFIFDEGQHHVFGLKSIKAITVIEPLSDEKRLKLEKELIPILSRAWGDRYAETIRVSCP